MTQGYLGIAGEESFLYPFFNLLRVLVFPELLSKKAFLSFSLAKLSTRDRIMQFYYLNHENDEVLRYGQERICREIVTDVLLAEHALRKLTQREETLHHRAMALQKTIAIESGRVQLDKTTPVESTSAQLEKANQQLKEVQLQYPRKEDALYRVTSMVRPYFKELYDSLRRDPEWFMREELVQDCSDRGGCCSRECGCCAQRYLSPRKKGRGHCTIECRCCIGFRGFEFPEEEKEEIRRDFEARLKIEHSVYLVKLANWSFRPLKQHQTLPKPKSRWH
jgi:hypothetical protein